MIMRYLLHRSTGGSGLQINTWVVQTLLITKDNAQTEDFHSLFDQR